MQEQIRQASGLPVSDVRTMDEVVSRSTSRQRFNMLLMTVFGGAALFLAAIGIYGLMAYSVQQRTQEIGIRLALGAETGQRAEDGGVSGHAPGAGGSGRSASAAAFGLTRLLATFLFGVKDKDRRCSRRAGPAEPGVAARRLAAGAPRHPDRPGDRAAHRVIAGWGGTEHLVKSLRKEASFTQRREARKEKLVRDLDGKLRHERRTAPGGPGENCLGERVSVNKHLGEVISCFDFERVAAVPAAVSVRATGASHSLRRARNQDSSKSRALSPGFQSCDCLVREENG